MSKRRFEFTVYGKLPTMNEEIEATKRHWSAYSKHKEGFTTLVSLYAKQQLKGVQITGQCAIVCRWYVRSRAQDADNISFATKYILDGLQWAGTIKNDNLKTVNGGLLHQFAIDKDNPRVEVVILENQKLSFE